MADHWTELRTLFDELVELDGAAREARLREIGARDAVLRERLEGMLAADRETASRLRGHEQAAARSILAAAPRADGDPLDLVGRTIGRYRVDELLGAGGMGVVYRATDLRLGRITALKFLPPIFSLDALAKQRFLNEARAASSLDHPNVCTIYEADETADGTLYIAMACYEGETLHARLKHGSFDIDEALDLAAQTARGLAAAHARGLVHRDVKPANMMVTTDGTLKILDFGVAKAADVTLTMPDQRPGTAAYMAPEQARGDAVDGRADLWSLGLVLYEMLTGTRPAVAGHAIHSVAAPSTLRPGVPAPVDTLILRLLADNPGERPAAGEIVDVLAPQTDGAAARFVHAARRRRRAGVVTGLLGTSGAIAIAITLLSSPSADLAYGSPTALAVFPFSVRGGADIQYLGEGIVNLLATSLDGAAEMRSVDPRALIARVHLLDERTAIGPDRASDIAAELGAGVYILGDILQTGDRIRIDASLYDGPGARPMGRGTSEGEPSDVLTMVDELAAQLLASGIATGDDSRITRIAAVTTQSLPALRKYLEGERLFHAGYYVPAVEAFQAAVAADSQFALAFYRLSIAAEYALRPDEATAAAEAAVRHADRLAEHDRLLLDALLAQRRGDHREAERMFRSIIATWPQDVEAWFQLGETLFHYGPVRGDPLEASAEAFERVIALDPDNAPALVHLHRIAAFTMDAAAVDTLGRRIRELAPAGDRSFETAIHEAATLGDPASIAAIIAEIDGLSEIQTPPLFSLGNWSHDFGMMESIFETLTNPSRSDELRALGHVHLAHFHAMHGRWRAAMAELATTETLDHARGLAHRAWLSLLPFIPVTRAELEQLRQALDGWNGGAVPASNIPGSYFSIHNGLHPDIRLYLLGLVQARLGETTAAETLARQLERPASDDATNALRLGFALSVRAAIAEALGDRANALRTIEQVEIGYYEPALFSPFLSRAAERFRRAALHEDARRDSDAARGYSTFEGFSFYDRVLAGPAQLGLGRIAEAEGRTAEARAHYERFLCLWSEADPEFSPLLDEATAASTRLREPGSPEAAASCSQP